MRTLTGAVTTAVGAPVTEPGYLVQIDFSPVLRLSSRGTLSWNGNTWTSWGIDVSGLLLDTASVSASGKLDLSDTDATISGYVLGQDVSGRAINIWKFYGSAPAAADPVLVFSGVGSDAEIPQEMNVVSISLAKAESTSLYAPGFYMTPENGFRWLPRNGTIIRWGGETYKITPEGS